MSSPSPSGIFSFDSKADNSSSDFNGLIPKDLGDLVDDRQGHAKILGGRRVQEIVSAKSTKKAKSKIRGGRRVQEIASGKEQPPKPATIQERRRAQAQGAASRKNAAPSVRNQEEGRRP